MYRGDFPGGVTPGSHIPGVTNARTKFKKLTHSLLNTNTKTATYLRLDFRSMLLLFYNSQSRDWSTYMTVSVSCSWVNEGTMRKLTKTLKRNGEWDIWPVILRSANIQSVYTNLEMFWLIITGIITEISN